jgi:muconolactone delta-isomerase
MINPINTTIEAREDAIIEWANERGLKYALQILPKAPEHLLIKPRLTETKSEVLQGIYLQIQEPSQTAKKPLSSLDIWISECHKSTYVIGGDHKYLSWFLPGQFENYSLLNSFDTRKELIQVLDKITDSFYENVVFKSGFYTWLDKNPGYNLDGDSIIVEGEDFDGCESWWYETNDDPYYCDVNGVKGWLVYNGKGKVELSIWRVAGEYEELADIFNIEGLKHSRELIAWLNKYGKLERYFYKGKKRKEKKPAKTLKEFLKSMDYRDEVAAMRLAREKKGTIKGNARFKKISPYEEGSKNNDR